MIEFLLSQTEMTYTSTGRHPLHIAALSSKPALVCLVRHWMKKQGKSEAEIQLQSSRMAAPLLLELLILLEPFKRIGFSRLRVHRVA